MGDSSLVLSDQYTRIAQYLFIGNVDSLFVYSHFLHCDIKELTWTFIISGQFKNSSQIKGSASGATQWEAFIKAFVEFGEAYLVKSLNLKDRNGLAGGLFVSTAKSRAMAELVERDAFLYHYRNDIPFKLYKIITIQDNVKTKKEIFIYEMNNCSPDFYTFMATDQSCAEGNNPCLLIGLGGHQQKQTAVSKSISEYHAMILDHQLRPNWCFDLEKDRSKAQRMTDFHHSHSRDERNIEKFKALCSKKSNKSFLRASINEKKWIVKKQSSPVKYFTYIKIEHEDLVKLEFGIPEISDLNLTATPLYHPLW